MAFYPKLVVSCHRRSAVQCLFIQNDQCHLRLLHSRTASAVATEPSIWPQARAAIPAGAAALPWVCPGAEAEAEAEVVTTVPSLAPLGAAITLQPDSAAAAAAATPLLAPVGAAAAAAVDYCFPTICITKASTGEATTGSARCD